MIPNIAITAIGAALVFGSGVYSGYKVTTASYLEQEVQRQEEVTKALLERDKVIAEINKQYQDNLYKAEKEHEKAIKTLKHNYAPANRDRLYVKADCGSTGTPATNKSTSIVDAGTTGVVQLPSDLEAKLYSEAERADTLVEQFRALQHFIIYQGLYGVQ